MYLCRKQYQPIFVFISLFLVTCFYVFSQSLPFKHYSVEDGLVSSAVTCIFQDSQSFLWIGTQRGISRFNGIDFQNFYLKDGLAHEYIADILEDKNGDIWVATLGGGISCFHSGGFKSYSKKDGLPHKYVTSIAEDYEGNLWLGTPSGFSKFAGKEFINYGIEDGLIHNSINDILVDNKGNLWLATPKGLDCFIKDTNRFTHYSTGDGLIYSNVQTLMRDRTGNIWIGTRGGLSCYQPGEKKLTSYGNKDGMAEDFISAFIEDRNGNIWIGTHSGIYIFSPVTSTFTNYNARNGLPNDIVFALFEDREGNIWLGTSMGLSRLHSLRNVNFSDKDGLPNNLIWTMVEDGKGRLWFGTDGGLSCYDGEKFKIFTNKDGLINNNIYKLKIDRGGNLWIAANGGVSVFSHGKFKNYSTDDGLPDQTVIRLEEDKDGVIWAGTVNGLCRFIKGKFVPPPFKHDNFPILGLLKDSSGNLWFASMTYLGKISANNTDKCNVTYYSRKNGLISNEISSLFEDSHGRIWIATFQGLSCLSKGKFINYSTENGLSDNACYFVLEDDYHHLWIGTGKGVNRFDGKNFRAYTSRDGLASFEMVQGSCLKDSQGNLWFGTAKGVTRFNPKLDRVNSISPPVYITQWQVMGTACPLPVSHDLELQYRQNYLNFGFVGISLTSPHDVIYKYQLEGIDQGWLETRDRNVAYPYLPPGSYHFKVTAINKDGFKSLTAAEIRFKILPPFWKTWWFRGLLIAAFLALTVGFLLWRVKREREKVANRERNKRLIMAQKMELLGILAGGAIHDLKNLLSIIITYSKSAARDVDKNGKSGKTLETIKNTAVTAVQVVKQILAFTRQSYEKNVAANLPGLMDEILTILKINTPPAITILWNPPKEDILLYINPTRFQQIVMNLCLNAVQAMPEGGKLTISLSKNQDSQVILEISDTGTGMTQETFEKIFDPLFTTKEPGKGTGLGLFVVKQIVEEYNGKIHVQSKPGEGTTFKLSFSPSQ